MEVGIYDWDKKYQRKLRTQLKRYSRKRSGWKDHFTFFDQPQTLLTRQKEQPFDVILLDVQSDGFLVAEQLRRAYQDLRIAFVTSTEQYALEAFRLCCFQYMLKPLTDEKLEELLDYARQLYLAGKQN